MRNDHYGQFSLTAMENGRKPITNGREAFYEETADSTKNIILDPFITSSSGHYSLPSRYFDSISIS